MAAKIESADGHLAAAIQSLGQSTSIYTLRRNPYHCAVNQMLLAELLQKRGEVERAIAEVESAGSLQTARRGDRCAKRPGLYRVSQSDACDRRLAED